MQHWQMSHVTRVNVSYRTYKWVKPLSVTPNTSRRHHQTNHWFHELIPDVPLAPKKSSQHIHTCEYVMSHMCMHRHVTHVYVSHSVTPSGIWRCHQVNHSLILHMNDSCHIFGWVTFHRVTSSKPFINITHMNDSCHTFGWVTFHRVIKKTIH